MKDIFSIGIKSPRLLLAMIFFCLGLVLTVVGFSRYSSVSWQEPDHMESSSLPDSSLSMDSLEAMFNSSVGPDLNQFDFVVEKNLFSPDREPWQSVVDERFREPADSVQGFSLNPNEFRLYGIAILGEERSALVYYQRLPEKYRHRLIKEDEPVYELPEGGSEVFRIREIHDDLVVIESGDQAFEVSLFGHERQTQDQAPSPPPTSEPDEGSTLQETDTGPQTMPGLPEILRQMGQEGREIDPGKTLEELDKEVEQGTMIRLDTPFGPVYRPAP